MSLNHNVNYYLIHGLDKNREKIMMNEFKKWEFDLNKITWILHPNKNEITDEFIDSIIIKEPSYSSGVFIPPTRTKNAKGLVCCTYKHYLALKDIVENNYEYGVIIEDNICFKGKIPELINVYIKHICRENMESICANKHKQNMESTRATTIHGRGRTI